MSTSDAYIVEFEKYAERHYIASFRKKYMRAWEITRKALEEEFKRIETLEGINNYIEKIYNCDEFKIYKTEFVVAGRRESKHASGNRCIIVAHPKLKKVRVLLVYGKGDVKGSHETAWWQEVIKENYPDYSHCF